MNIDIEKLVQMYPNNADLGKAVREMYYLQKGVIKPSQDNLQEIEQRKGGTLYS